MVTNFVAAMQIVEAQVLQYQEFLSSDFLLNFGRPLNTLHLDTKQTVSITKVALRVPIIGVALKHDACVMFRKSSYVLPIL